MPIKLQTPRRATDSQFVLPFPPSANRYWRTRVMMMRGKPIVSTYVSTEAKSYKLAVRRAMAGVFPTATNVKVSLDFYRPRKVGDLDNRIKVCLDSLIGILWEDDNQIVEINARRFDDKNDPRVVVRLCHCDD